MLVTLYGKITRVLPVYGKITGILPVYGKITRVLPVYGKINLNGKISRALIFAKRVINVQYIYCTSICMCMCMCMCVCVCVCQCVCVHNYLGSCFCKARSRCAFSRACSLVSLYG